MERRTGTAIERARPTALPDMPPGLRAMHAMAADHLELIKAVASKGILDDADRRTIAWNLQQLGHRALETVSKQVQTKFPKGINVKNPAQFEADVAAFEKHFGHPPSIDDETGAIDLKCSTNAVLQSMLLSRLGSDMTGTFNAPDHVAPAVKIKGTTYVLDHRFYGDKRYPYAPTVREYVKALAAARGDKNHPLNIDVKAKEIAPKPPKYVATRQIVSNPLSYKLASKGGPNPSLKGKTDYKWLFPEAPRLDYHGGSTAALGAPHYNMALSYEAMAERKGLTTAAKAALMTKAGWHYAESIVHNPNDPDAHHWLGVILHNQGDYEGARQHFQTALQIRPGDRDGLTMMAKVLTSQGKLKEAADYRKQAKEAKN